MARASTSRRKGTRGRCRWSTRRRGRSSRRSGRSATWCGRSPSMAQQTLLFANINDLLGFEVADLKTGAILHHVEVPGRHARQVADARHPEPRHRDDAGRDRDLDRRQRQQLPPHLRRDGDAADDEGQRQGARRARLDHLRHRRQARLSIDRRRDRRAHQADRRDAAGRERRERGEREDARDRFRRRQAVGRRRPVRQGQEAVVGS